MFGSGVEIRVYEKKFMRIRNVWKEHSRLIGT